MVYVDKTAYIYELTRQPYSYFLSRPRRFGKSLLLSTIAAYFQGRRELFEGLAIAQLETEWEAYPVIQLSLSTFNGVDIESLYAVITGELDSNARRLAIELDSRDIAVRFNQLIERAHEKYGRKVVVLIDEYDKPLNETRHLDNECHEKMRSILRGFYSCVKDSGEHLRFAMLTGVTKYSHVSIFSGLNNLTDISLEPWCNAICGISETEMHQYFSDDLAKFGEINQLVLSEVSERFRLHYDGYRFARTGENIYNPYSVMRAFTSMEFANYWFGTGTPSHLLKALALGDFDFDDLEGVSATADELMGLPSADGNPVGLLYQSGYLTIKGYDDGLYTLGFPNREVSSGFFSELISVIHPNPMGRGFSARNVRKAAQEGNPEQLVHLLEMGLMDYCSDQTKDLSTEAIFNSLLYGMCHAIGLDTKAEYHTSNGRIDLVIETKRYIYLMEFKINSTAAIAIKQIDTRHYSDKYKYDPRTLFKIGVNFDTKLRQISDTLIHRR